MWSTAVIFWTAMGCFFVPIYITALICSIVKICRDRKRILEKNEMLRQSRETGYGIETQGSVKRPNIEIIHDEERARQFRPAGGKPIREFTGNSPELDTHENDNKSNLRKGTNNNVGNLSNGHTTTHATIERRLANHETPRGHLQVPGNSADVSYSSGRRDEIAAHRSGDADSEYSDSLADTEIICDAGPSSERYRDRNSDGDRPGNSSSEHAQHHHHHHNHDAHHDAHTHSKPPRKDNKRPTDDATTGHQQQHDSPHHQQRQAGAVEMENRSAVHAWDVNTSVGQKSDVTSAGDDDRLGGYQVRNRRISSGVIQDQDEKRRRSQEYSMTVLRSKSEETVGHDNVNGSRSVYEQQQQQQQQQEGRDNHAFERSTEITRM